MADCGRLPQNDPVRDRQVFQLARRGMFIQTQDTPNPNAMMFLPGQPVMGEVRLAASRHAPISADVSCGLWLQGGGTAVFSDIGESRSSPLAKSLFQIQGVSTVFYGADYISVTIASSDWCASKTAPTRFYHCLPLDTL